MVQNSRIQIRSHSRITITFTGFSLNFSSAGKGPFMDGKAKNIDKTFLGSGGWGEGVGRWSEVHGPRRHWEIFLFPYFKTYFTQICCRVIFRQQIKTFHSKMHVPKKECCIYSTVQKSSTVQKKCMCKKWHKKLLCHKLQATARSESAVFVVYLQEL